MSGQRWIARTTMTLFLAATAAIWLSTSGTLGGFTVAKTTNPTNTARVATLSIANSLGGSNCSATASGATVPSTCTGSLYPSTVTATAAAGPTNTITNTGTVPASVLVSKYRVPGCGPASLANSITNGTSGVLLPRGNTVFNPSSGPPVTSGGSITLDGSTGTYAASTAATSEPQTNAVTTRTYGLDIWFKTTSTTTSPLFSFSASPLVDTTQNSDRTLYLDATGKIGFIASPTVAITPATATGVTKYNDNTWHFAAVSLSGTLAGGYTAGVSVDGKTVGSASSLVLGALRSYSGYWHVGWAPAAPATGYFAGSLSGFVVDDSGTAPTSTTASPSTYTFDANATQLWPMNDSGGSYDGTTVAGIYTGSYPSGAANPCQSVTVNWALTNPAATVASGAALSSLSSAVTVADPDPNGAQTSTISLSRSSTVNTYLVGLIVYAPVVATYSAGTNWQVAFAWSTAAPGASAGSTFVIK